MVSDAGLPWTMDAPPPHRSAVTCPCGKRDRESFDLNIGGEIFPQARLVASKCPALVSAAKQDRDGLWFVDRNGKLYGYILPFLDKGQLAQHPEDSATRGMLMREAEFLGLTDLVTILKAHVGAPEPPDENTRLRRLKSIQNTVKTSDTVHFDHITRIVAALHEAPMSMLSFVEKQVHVCVSRFGFEHATRPRSFSFCAHTLVPDPSGQVKPLVVSDTLRDQRFQNNPLVAGAPHVRSYFGCPLVTSDGFRLGALSTMDSKPQVRPLAQLQLLMNFSYIAILEFEREQLNDALVDSSDLESSPNYTTTAFRVLRMQQAVKDLIALVHIGHGGGAMGYRLLYTNSVWSSTVGVNLAPPTDLRCNAEVTGSGVPWSGSSPPECGPLLWHWLRLEDENEDDFDARLQQQPRGTNLVVRGILRSAPGMPRQKMVGRVVDADVAMDLSLSASSLGQREHDQLSGNESVAGRFVFVILHPDAF
eukprot:TRINITY_DN54210_c0_g1_i1.p1 TRINITY_DN54210_c0_g1~~TRINITY_DN54210_c0_g1_i1.p1  ORF type:complete len:477 (-),score=52.73 TRINITY_DN54210_c0_g1_i1:240-1670(-)